VECYDGPKSSLRSIMRRPRNNQGMPDVPGRFLMKAKKILFWAATALSATALFSISPSIPGSSAEEGTKINIAYSGNVLGYMEPCG
jgi:hypothetical protein